MIARSRVAHLLLPLLAALGFSACDEPPRKEIGAAEAALAQARHAGAERYTPERYREAELALREAKKKVQQKDYRGALSSATEATDKSRQAAQQAAAAKTVIRSANEVAQAEIQASFDEIAQVREGAANDKVPDKVFDELTAEADQAQQALQGIAKAMESGDLLEAQKAAAELKARVAPLPGRFREAVDAWQAAHPKRGGRAPAPPVKKK